ncbi:hypothetical protein PWT90_04846 [Aphanocladium album]|nr:hypothetical protein PWT90_04846 [Aphanocladium album]
MATWKHLAPPFSIQLLKQHADVGQQGEHDPLLNLLPSLYRNKSGDLARTGQNITACVEDELQLKRLANIHDWLWVAGLPLPPRALHHQLLLGREILITEQMDLHLVWTTGKVFLKPIPRFVLEPTFWTRYLCCGECGCSSSVTKPECVRPRLYRQALGFLFSYAALLLHESDFRIAEDKHLLPPEVTWPAWRTLVEQLDTENIYPYIDQRFIHGELRLSRLNKIYALTKTPMRRYMAHWNQYSAFFHDNFTTLASATVYIAIVLTAMQVGLATESLGHNQAFQSASYGFTVFSILGPLIAASLIMLQFSGIFIRSLVQTIHRTRERYCELHLAHF